VTVLASGSGGNSILVEGEGGTRVLVDAGLAAREIARRMEKLPILTRLDDVTACLVTHEHGDHVAGAQTLSSAGIAVYATDGTARAAKLTRAQTIAAGQKLTVGCLEVMPVALPHDAAEPVAFIFSDGRATCGILTDCGHPTQEVADAFAACDILVLEANHDPDMLRAGSYPPFLKRRVAGKLGHLSNDQAAQMLRLMGKPAFQVLILAHLSELNNKARLARSIIERQLTSMAAPGQLRPRVLVAVQEHPLSPVTCEDGKSVILPQVHGRQLSLAFE
jgi:phosphoribosyl 1,2-cyclic phosphodiesterase